MSVRVLVFYGSYRSDRMGIRLADYIVAGLQTRGMASPETAQIRHIFGVIESATDVGGGDDAVASSTRGHCRGNAGRLHMQGSRYRSAVGCSSGCTLQVLLAAVAAVVFGWPERALAQAYGAVPETMQIEDQPGYVPNPEDERLPAIYQRQVVFYRTTESPW
jgi:hypothetical protein